MDVLRTIKYMSRNGLLPAYYAVRERLAARKKEPYVFEACADAELARQREACKNLPSDRRVLVSIVVPAYETLPAYMEALLASVEAQTYPYYELVIADASASDVVAQTVSSYLEGAETTAEMNEAVEVRRMFREKVQYHRLAENKGISENSNAALALTKGEYVALLDHDDLITPDALFALVQKAQETGADLVYSDEDKCDETGGNYRTPHHKLDFNLDMFLTNNYICHFTMIRGSLVRELGFRPAYDGAQDYDLFLRVLLASGADKMSHVKRILYHWRCHSGSTAENPSSKEYAYEAGRKALESYYEAKRIPVMVKHGKHNGFYDTIYTEKDLFALRPEVGAVGGPLLKKNKVVGGAMLADGTVLYEGLHKHYSGYMNHADLAQDVEALDLRNIRVREELKGLAGQLIAENPQLTSDGKALSLAFSKAAREKGYLLVYQPKMRL